MILCLQSAFARCLMTRLPMNQMPYARCRTLNDDQHKKPCFMSQVDCRHSQGMDTDRWLYVVRSYSRAAGVPLSDFWKTLGHSSSGGWPVYEAFLFTSPTVLWSQKQKPRIKPPHRSWHCLQPRESRMVVCDAHRCIFTYMVVSQYKEPPMMVGLLL